MKYGMNTDERIKCSVSVFNRFFIRGYDPARRGGWRLGSGCICRLAVAVAASDDAIGTIAAFPALCDEDLKSKGFECRCR